MATQSVIIARLAIENVGAPRRDSTQVLVGQCLNSRPGTPAFIVSQRRPIPSPFWAARNPSRSQDRPARHTERRSTGDYSGLDVRAPVTLAGAKLD